MQLRVQNRPKRNKASTDLVGWQSAGPRVHSFDKAGRPEQPEDSVMSNTENCRLLAQRSDSVTERSSRARSKDGLKTVCSPRISRASQAWLDNPFPRQSISLSDTRPRAVESQEPEFLRLLGETPSTFRVAVLNAPPSHGLPNDAAPGIKSKPELLKTNRDRVRPWRVLHLHALNPRTAQPAVGNNGCQGGGWSIAPHGDLMLKHHPDKISQRVQGPGIYPSNMLEG
jgi:hypothetical protein